jgi:hypothetical protein
MPLEGERPWRASVLASRAHRTTRHAIPRRDPHDAPRHVASRPRMTPHATWLRGPDVVATSRARRLRPAALQSDPPHRHGSDPHDAPWRASVPASRAHRTTRHAIPRRAPHDTTTPRGFAAPHDATAPHGFAARIPSPRRMASRPGRRRHVARAAAEASRPPERSPAPSRLGPARCPLEAERPREPRAPHDVTTPHGFAASDGVSDRRPGSAVSGAARAGGRARHRASRAVPPPSAPRGWPDPAAAAAPPGHRHRAARTAARSPRG